MKIVKKKISSEIYCDAHKLIRTPQLKKMAENKNMSNTNEPYKTLFFTQKSFSVAGRLELQQPKKKYLLLSSIIN